MTISTGLQEKVVGQLTQESNLCRELLTALSDERTALERRDFDAFSQSVQTKQACAAGLEHSEQKLFHLMAGAGFSENRDGFMNFLESLDPGSDRSGIHDTWNQLHLLMTDCQKQNRINGQIINASMHNTQQALDILNGRDLHASTYDQSGKTSDNGDNASLVVA
jgi:flagellar biosynthesis/type III secretory pathway chaperone